MNIRMNIGFKDEAEICMKRKQSALLSDKENRKNIRKFVKKAVNFYSYLCLHPEIIYEDPDSLFKEIMEDYEITKEDLLAMKRNGNGLKSEMNEETVVCDTTVRQKGIDEKIKENPVREIETVQEEKTDNSYETSSFMEEREMSAEEKMKQAMLAFSSGN